MPENFYAGHEFSWTEKFLKAIPKNRKLTGCSAVCLAEAIHHQFVYTKTQTFLLNHTILRYFGLNRRYIKPYLLLFQDAGLIKVGFKKGASPRITLLILPNYYLNNCKNNKQNKININKGDGSPNKDRFKYLLGQVDVLTRTGNMTLRGQVESKESEPRQPIKQGNQVRKVSNIINFVVGDIDNNNLPFCGRFSMGGYLE